MRSERWHPARWRSRSLALRTADHGHGRARDPRVRAAPGRAPTARVQQELLRHCRRSSRTCSQPISRRRCFAVPPCLPRSPTALFAGLSALVGFLFAFNAMLLTVPRRRALVSDLRLDGYSARHGRQGAAVRRARSRRRGLAAWLGARRGPFDRRSFTPTRATSRSRSRLARSGS